MNGSGATYVFARSGGNWTQQAYVKAAKATAGVIFGYAVALSANGDTMASTTFDEDRGFGSMYIFTRSGSGWSQQARLQAAISERGDSFGTSIGLSDDGNTMVAGALDEDCLATGVNPPGCNKDQPTDTSAGAASVFVRTGTAWKEQALLKASNSRKGATFGSRIAISGDGNTIAAGAPIEDGGSQGINGNQADASAPSSGAVYLFTRSGPTWVQQAYVKGSNTKAGDNFGGSVALTRDGRMLAVGAYGEDGAAKGINGNQTDRSVPDSGAVYVFSAQR
jgi:hypothetical protein